MRLAEIEINKQIVPGEKKKTDADTEGATTSLRRANQQFLPQRDSSPCGKFGNSVAEFELDAQGKM